MRRSKASIAVELILLSTLVLLLILPACRKEAEPLDRNRAPETFRTVAPPETTEADYRVHLFWHGEDKDGVVTRYIWFRSDTVMTLDPDGEPDIEILDWNPRSRKEDYLRGTFTARNDTEFVFTGYDSRSGALLNRQAFHIASVDDGGLIDPTPARIQFFARVKGIPQVKFWIDLPTEDLKPYNPAQLDTVAMYKPFSIRFTASTINNIVTGYRWIYAGTIYPDVDMNGVPEWHIPPPDTLDIPLANVGEDALSSGDFYLRVIARDEAGAMSKADIVTGEGACHVIVNHDPDTRVLRGECQARMRDGRDTTIVITYDQFLDGIPDTLPYNSLLRMTYEGWDDQRDSLEFPPPNEVPIRFQFLFDRTGKAEDGSISAYRTPWLPTARAEDTNKYDDVDSTTMRIGTYGYDFFVRSFDEQYRADGTPAQVRFWGNFPPKIDNVQLKIDQIPAVPGLILRDVPGDTLYVGTVVTIPNDDTLSAYRQDVDEANAAIRLYYRFYITAGGEDDWRDPPGSGIKGWKYRLDGPEDYYFRNENEWIYDNDVDTLYQELEMRIIYPAIDLGGGNWVIDEANIEAPGFFGPQTFVLKAKDIRDTDRFAEGIRGVSPVYEGDVLVAPGAWVEVIRSPENYAKIAEYSAPLYIKLVK